MQYKVDDNSMNYFSFGNTDAERAHCKVWNDEVRLAKEVGSKLISEAYDAALALLPVLDGAEFINSRYEAITALEAKRAELYVKEDKKVKEMDLLRTAMRFTNMTVAGTQIGTITDSATTYIGLLAAKQVANEQGNSDVETVIEAKIEALVCGEMLEEIEQHHKAVRDINATVARANGAVRGAVVGGKLYE